MNFLKPVKSSNHMRQNRTRNDRRGVVAVEFAVVVPVLLAISLGMIELTRVFETQDLLETAAREGARFGAMDKDGMLQSGQSSNEKLVNDVENFLASNGIEGESVVVEVKDFENPSDDFDLDDPDNQLKLFEVIVSVDYSEVSLTPVAAGDDYALSASVVFRNGTATISE